MLVSSIKYRSRWKRPRSLTLRRAVGICPACDRFLPLFCRVITKVLNVVSRWDDASPMRMAKFMPCYGMGLRVHSVHTWPIVCLGPEACDDERFKYDQDHCLPRDHTATHKDIPSCVFRPFHGRRPSSNLTGCLPLTFAHSDRILFSTSSR